MRTEIALLDDNEEIASTSPVTEVNGEDDDDDGEEWERYLKPNPKKEARAETPAADDTEKPDTDGEEIEEIRTRRTFSSSPYTKGLVVLGLVATGVLGFAGAVRILSGIGSTPVKADSGTRVVPDTNPPTEVFKSGDSAAKSRADDDTIAQLQTSAAMGEQARELRRIQDTPTAPVGRPPTVIPRTAPPGTVTVGTVPAPPPVSSGTVTGAPPVYRSPSPVFRRPSLENARVGERRRSFTPVSRREVGSTPASGGTRKDPPARWRDLAGIGSYRFSDAEAIAAAPPPDSPERTGDWEGTIGGGTGSPPPTARDTGYRPTVAPESAPATLLVGARARGTIEIPIAWSGQAPSGDRSYLVRLSEPLKDSSGKISVAANSYIVVRVTEASATGMLSLEGVSVQGDREGTPVEIPLPVGALLILGGGGGVLQAGARLPDTSGNNLLDAALSGVSNVTGLINRPRSQTITDFGASVTNASPDYLSGFVEGMAGELLRSGRSRNQREQSSIQSRGTLFVLDRGTEVEIFVNKTFTLGGGG